MSEVGLPHGNREMTSNDFQPTERQRCWTSRHVSPSDGHRRHLSRSVCSHTGNVRHVYFSRYPALLWAAII